RLACTTPASLDGPVEVGALAARAGATRARTAATDARTGSAAALAADGNALADGLVHRGALLAVGAAVAVLAAASGDAGLRAIVTDDAALRPTAIGIDEALLPVVARVVRIGLALVHDAVLVLVFVAVVLAATIGVGVEVVRHRRARVAVGDAAHRRRLGVGARAVESVLRGAEEAIAVGIRSGGVGVAVAVGVVGGVVRAPVEQAVVVAVEIVGIAPDEDLE